MDEHDKWVVSGTVIGIVAFFIMIATITVSSFVTNSNTQKACIGSGGSWTVSAGGTGKSCIIAKD
jgi:hypothetical protein